MHLSRRARSFRPLQSDLAERATPKAVDAVRSAWWPAAAAITLMAVAFGFAFGHEVTSAYYTWIGTTAYNHCFLILPLIAYLLWERRAVFGAVAPRPSFWPLLAMPLLSAVWLAAAVLDLTEGRQFAVVAMFEVGLVAVLGQRAFRALLAPALFLFFLVPTGEFLIAPLQKITATIAVDGLQLLHIPVYREGLMIEIPEGRFEIAEACAGLRFLVASIVFGCFFSVVMYRSYWRRAAFICLSLIVPIAANGLRAFGIIYLAHLEGSAAAVEADHILYGWIFFSLVILILIMIGTRFTDAREPLAIAPTAAPGAPLRSAATAAAALLLALIGPAYGARLNAQFQAATPPLAQLPQLGAPWRATPEGAPPWRPLVRGSEQQDWLQSFSGPGASAVIRYVAVYRLRPIGNALTRGDNRIADDVSWQTEAQQRAQIPYHGGSATVTSSQIIDGPHRRLVWSFYVVDGAIAPTAVAAKLLQARAVLLRHASSAAFVAISASDDNPGFPARAQLADFIEANAPLIERLKALSSGFKA